MTLDIQKGETRETIPCPDGVVMVGLRLRNVVEVSANEKEFCEAFHARCEKLVRQWEGEELTLYFYITDDPALRTVEKVYAGLTMLEVDFRDLKVTVLLG